MKTAKRIIALMLCTALLLVFGACNADNKESVSDVSQTVSEKITGDVPAGRRTASQRTGINATNPMVISTSTLDGKFNPFYATSGYDSGIVQMTQIPLLTSNENAEPVAGINEDCLAYSYKMTVSEDQSKSTYEFVLKKGILFSDGTEITGKDVLFNLYEYLDPAYSGSSTLYSMDIQGLNAYRTQTVDENVILSMRNENLTRAEAAVAAYVAGEKITAEEEAAIWSAVKDCITADSKTLMENDYIPSYLGLEEPEDFLKNYSRSIILIFVGGLSYSAATGEWTADPSTGIDVEKLAQYTTDEYIDASLRYIQATMTAADYDAAFGYGTVTEGTDKTAVNALVKSYELAYLKENKGKVKSVSGITLTKVTGEDKVEREVLTVVLNGVDPKAIRNFMFNVAPMAYYSTEELSKKADGVENFGVEFSNAEFQNQLKTKNVPMGAGPYIAADKEGNLTREFNKFLNNGIVNFIANDKFMLTAPLIKYLRFKTVASGSELSALQNDEVHFSDPSATSDNISLIAGTEYTKILVDFLGYGYIGMNAQLIPDINARKAIASAMNVELALEFYSGGLADVLYRSMSKVSWAYPKDAKAMYTFDESGETSKAFFLASDKFKKNKEGKIVYKNGSTVKYTFTLPMASEESPAGPIFLKAKEVLAKIGVEVTIDVDDNALQKLQDNVIAVWAGAWVAETDPDMFQVFCSDPSVNNAGSPNSYGLYWLFQNGSEEEKTLLTELNQLIYQGRSTLNPNERKPIYYEALDKVMELCVEIPTYQRKDMNVYNSKVIDGRSLFQNVTPYKGPLSEIWNVSLVLG